MIPVREDRLARLIGIGEHGAVDVDDDLVALGRAAGIEVVVKRGFRDHPEGSFTRAFA